MSTGFAPRLKDEAAQRLLGVSRVEACGGAHPVAEINADETIGFDELMCMSISVEEMTEVADASDTISRVKQTRRIDHEGGGRRPDLLDVVPSIGLVVMDMSRGDRDLPARGQHLA